MSDISYINKDLLMEGTLESREGQIVIAGQFKGNITAKSVIIEGSAHVMGNVNSEHLKVEGKITGDITADLLEVSSSGTIDGKLKTNSLSVDTGAQISGNVGRIS